MNSDLCTNHFSVFKKICYVFSNVRRTSFQELSFLKVFAIISVRCIGKPCLAQLKGFCRYSRSAGKLSLKPQAKEKNLAYYLKQVQPYLARYPPPYVLIYLALLWLKTICKSINCGWLGLRWSNTSSDDDERWTGNLPLVWTLIAQSKFHKGE